MAIQYVVTEAELMSLIEQLELAALRACSSHVENALIHRTDIEDLHRTFHFYVVRWVQDIGFKGHR